MDVRRQIRKAAAVAAHGRVRYRSITRTEVDQIVAVIVTEPVGWHTGVPQLVGILEGGEARLGW